MKGGDIRSPFTLDNYSFVGLKLWGLLLNLDFVQSSFDQTFRSMIIHYDSYCLQIYYKPLDLMI